MAWRSLECLEALAEVGSLIRGICYWPRESQNATSEKPQMPELEASKGWKQQFGMNRTRYGSLLKHSKVFVKKWDCDYCEDTQEA